VPVSYDAVEENLSGYEKRKNRIVVNKKVIPDMNSRAKTLRAKQNNY
jgi:hypothetical protein